MPFQIKDFTSIVASEVNHARGATDKITDFLPGSVARTILEAPAVEIEELYLQMFAGLREAIPVAVYLSFGFERLGIAYARGNVRVIDDTPPTADVVVPAGTDFSAEDGRSYFSTEAVTWKAGSDQVLIPIQAEVAGSVGNASAGVINASDYFGDAYAISNLPIDSGRDQETEEAREARFAEFIRALSKGTVAACLQAAKSASLKDADGVTLEYVTRAGVVEIPGRVSIYVYSSGGSPTQALMDMGQAIIDGYKDPITGAITPGVRSAGVRVDVFPMAEREVDFSADVRMFPGYSLTASVKSQMQDTLATLLTTIAPGDVLYIGDIVETMLDVDGVRQVVPLSNENILCGNNQVLVPGSITLEAL